jgi:hypothetical protein
MRRVLRQAIAPDLRDGGQPAEVGGSGLGCAGLHDAVAQAKDPDRADPLSPCGWPAEPAGPSRDIAAQCPAGQWTAPTIHVAATPPSSRAAPLRSSRSEKTGGRAKKIDRPHAPATTPCAARCDGRAFWTRWTGYHARGRIEAKPLIVCSQTTAGQWMHCVKLLGQRIAARDPDRQTAEIHIRIALMNRCNALGTAKIIRTA